MDDITMPAFPSGDNFCHEGMSYRQWLAGLFVQGIMIHGIPFECRSEIDVARVAIKHADALIKLQGDNNG